MCWLVDILGWTFFSCQTASAIPRLQYRPTDGEDESKRNLPRQGRTLQNTEISSGFQNSLGASLLSLSALYILAPPKYVAPPIGCSWAFPQCTPSFSETCLGWIWFLNNVFYLYTIILLSMFFYSLKRIWKLKDSLNI